MVRCMRLGSVVRASGRALSTAPVRQQRRALVLDTADQDQVTRKNFADVQRERTEQAKHSILISCPSKLREATFLKHLSQHGEIANHFFFDSIGTHAVVEFVKRESVDSLLHATRIPNDDVYVVPFKSRLIKMKLQENDPPPSAHSSPAAAAASSKLLGKLCAAKSNVLHALRTGYQLAVLGCKILSNSKRGTPSIQITDQAHILLQDKQLTEESIRIRYLVSSLVNDFANTYFPEATVHLYGSSVNSFGKMGCDLDLFLNLNNNINTSRTASGSLTTEYLIKRAPSGRVAQQRTLSFVAECLDSFFPGCTGVFKILSARCPLIRFFHHPSGLHCDLTADNSIALRSSELLYIYGNIDSRVRPLVYTLRCWAQVHGITKTVSGHWITNFSLTSLILFFLQKRNPPILPTLDELKNLADKKDTCIIDGHDCTFVSDLNKIKPSANTESLDALLVEFLQFYGMFDFSKNSIDIRKGVVRSKPDSSPLYIHNPFEQSLNVSKNVNNSQLERFVQIAQESSWTLQKQASQRGEGNWGLASILCGPASDKAGIVKKDLVSQRLGSLLQSLKNNDKNKQMAEKKKKADH